MFEFEVQMLVFECQLQHSSTLKPAAVKQKAHGGENPLSKGEVYNLCDQDS